VKEKEPDEGDARCTLKRPRPKLRAWWQEDEGGWELGYNLRIGDNNADVDDNYVMYMCVKLGMGIDILTLIFILLFTYC